MLWGKCNGLFFFSSRIRYEHVWYWYGIENKNEKNKK